MLTSTLESLGLCQQELMVLLDYGCSSRFREFPGCRPAKFHLPVVDALATLCGKRKTLQYTMHKLDTISQP